MSEKIRPHHLARRAVLYVRQSSAHQLQHNEESRRLQYAMAERLRSLGWRDIETIDEDLGKSAAGKVERTGFQRLVSEVSLGKVGAVAARELSRLSRNSRDWQQLMEVCRYVDTVLVDHDAIYDIRYSNDRLLLGLKGNMNEYELDMLRVRALEARNAKARRGEYYAKIAVGYRKTLEGGIEQHPDARVRHTLRLTFDKVLELGSLRQALLWMREHRIEVPVNANGRGALKWRHVTYAWLHMVVTNPIYAGSYVYGRTTATAKLAPDGSVRRGVARKVAESAAVLLHDRHDGYISRDVFERIQTMITRNRLNPGAPRVGQALLAGLLRCKRCGERLVVYYSGTRVRVPRYECSRANLDRGENRCIGFSGLDVDVRIGELVLEVVQPGAIEASAKLANDTAHRSDAAIEALQLELKSARYAADRARRQYDEAEPENRLVVDELERRWNATLERVASLEQRLGVLSAGLRDKASNAACLATLAQDLEHVWHAPTTDMRLKKRLVRTLVEEIIVDVGPREIMLLIHWKGGVHTEAVVGRRRRGETRLRTPIDVVEAIRVLARVCNDEHVARALNASGIKTARQNPWTRELVRAFRSSHDIAVYSSAENANWLPLSRAASLAGVAELTLKRAIERGVIAAARPVSRGPWVLAKDELLRPDVLERITKKPRPRARKADPSAPTPNQLSLMIPRM